MSTKGRAPRKASSPACESAPAVRLIWALKNRRLETAVEPDDRRERVPLTFLFSALGRHRFEREPQKLAYTGVLLASIALERSTLIDRDAHGDLTMWITRGFAAFEVEARDSGANNFTRGRETVTFTTGLDSRDERFREIERERGRRLTR